jgi:hypothetical protein
VGVRTGAASNIVALDIDRKYQSAIEWLKSNKFRIPTTRVHRTRSGGFHILFQHADNLGCTVSKIAPGVDTRGDGGYIIWWPAAGLPVLVDAPLAPWPQWLFTALAPKLQSRPPSPIRRIPDSCSIAALVRFVAGAGAGERNRATYWAACRAGEMVASGLLGADDAAELIIEAAMRTGLPCDEASRTAWSGINRTGGTPRA